MWWYVLYAVLGIVGLIVLLFVALVINLHLASARSTKGLRAALKPIGDALAGGQQPDAAMLRSLAASPMTRGGLFDLLSEHQSLKLFPREFAAREAFAEADLVFWLSHPNELKNAPDAIELVTKLNLDSESAAGVVRWYLFRFRTDPPHWASGKGWMAGVGGPYPEGYIGPINVPLIRSELTPIDAMSPEQHVRQFHDRAKAAGVFDDVAKLRRPQAAAAR